MIVYAHLTFTSKRLLEVEVIADIEVINNQSIETKRAAVGYFAFVVQVGRIPTLKVNNISVIVPYRFILIRVSYFI